MRGFRGGQTCDICGGSHKTFPLADSTTHDGELGGYCPHCGYFNGLGISHPDEFVENRHRDDGVAETVCDECNSGFKIKVR